MMCDAMPLCLSTMTTNQTRCRRRPRPVPSGRVRLGTRLLLSACAFVGSTSCVVSAQQERASAAAAPQTEQDVTVEVDGGFGVGAIAAEQVDLDEPAASSAHVDNDQPDVVVTEHHVVSDETGAHQQSAGVEAATPDRPVWRSASSSSRSGDTAEAFAGKRKSSGVASSSSAESDADSGKTDAGDEVVASSPDQESEVPDDDRDSGTLSTDDTNHLAQAKQHPSAVFGAVKHDGAASQVNEKSYAAFVKPGDAKSDSSSPSISSDAATAAMRKKAAAAAAAASSAIPKLNATGANKEAHDIEPPEGYYLAAHVVTDPRDGLSYFSEPVSLENDRHLEIPYQDCGYSGSTTQAIPLKSGHFRHLPPGAHPQTWTTATSTRSPGAALLSTLISGGGDSSEGSTAGGGGHRKDPQLLVVLKPLELTVSGNGGESRRFKAGDCVLLEDTVGKGHKLSPVGNEELSVLMLALPRHHHAHHHHHHHQKEQPIVSPTIITGEDESNEKVDEQSGTFRPISPVTTSSSGRHLSVLGLRRRGINRGRLPRPCRTPLSPSLSGEAAAASGKSSATFLSDGESVAATILGDGFIGRRRAVIGAIGFGLSSFSVYFLAKVAPWVLGLMGLVTAFIGGAVLFDGLVGAVWTEVSELVQKIKAGSLLIDEDDGDDED